MAEYIISLKIEKLEEGEYLATIDTLRGLVAQGRTIAETMEIAQEGAIKDWREQYTSVGFQHEILRLRGD